MRSIKKCCELIQLNASNCDIPLENPIYALCTEIMNIEKAYKEENPESEDYRRGLCDGIAQQSEKSVAITDYLVNFFEIFKDDETPDTNAIILTLQNAMISAFVNGELPVWEMPEEKSEEPIYFQE